MNADQRWLRGAAWVALGAAALYPLWGSDYIAHLAVVTASFAILALSLDLVLGHTGMVSIAHAGLFGIGAYASGLLGGTPGWPFWAAAPVGSVVAALTAAGMGLLFARMRGSYLAIGTFAFGELIRILLNQWRDLTGGPLGLSIESRPAIGLGPWRLSFDNQHSYYALMLVLGIALVLGLRRLFASRLGTMMALVRDDPELAAAVGVPVLRVKVTSLFISGLIAGAVGSLYGAYLQFIAPESFSAQQSIQLVMIVVIGGAGTLLGPVVGAMLIVLLPQVLRIEPTYSLIATGVVLVLVVLLMPRGIVGQLRRVLAAPARGARRSRGAQAARSPVEAIHGAS